VTVAGEAVRQVAPTEPDGTGNMKALTAADRIARALGLGTALVALSACGGIGGGSTTTQEKSYDISQQITALVVDARVAAVNVETGDGPVTVTETYHFGDDKPSTSHRVDGSTLHWIDTGCRNDEVRCDVELRVRIPADASLQVKAEVGAVTVAGLAGSIDVTTEAGAFEGTSLSADKVRVTSKAGATSLEFAEAPTTVQARTEAGTIRVRVPSGTAYAVEVDTDLGTSNISVQRDPASDHRIAIHSSAGAVTVENA
jgi:hypothetical protein